MNNSSKTNLHYTSLDLNVLNNDFYNLAIHNKSLYHSLLVINKYGFNFNLKTIYKQIKLGLLRLKPSDLPRTTSKVKNKEIDKTYKRDVTGHTYEDYLNLIENKSSAIKWQIDCVQSIQGEDEPVFLTLQIIEIKFLFIFIIKKITNKMFYPRTTRVLKRTIIITIIIKTSNIPIQFSYIFLNIPIKSSYQQ